MIAARCGFAGTREPETSGVAFLHHETFGEHWKTARTSLSDDYRLLFGPVTSTREGDRARVRVELRKQKTKNCSIVKEPKTPRLPYASIEATLARGAGATWTVERADLRITDPLPPDPSSPTAAFIVEKLTERYRGAKTLEARYRASVSTTGVHSIGRHDGILRADASGALSLRASEGQRHIEVGLRTLRFMRTANRRKAAHLGPNTLYAFALVFLGTDLRERFTLERSREQERCTEDYVLVAIPKRREPILKRLRLSVDRKTFTVEVAQALTLGIRSWISFEHQKLDVPLPADEFSLDPPPGVVTADRFTVSELAQVYITTCAFITGDFCNTADVEPGWRTIPGTSPPVQGIRDGAEALLVNGTITAEQRTQLLQMGNTFGVSEATAP